MSAIDPRGLASRPFALEANKVAYLIEGGGLLPRFLGEDAGEGRAPSQLWIGSTVASALGAGQEGLSRLAAEEGGSSLKELLESDPAAFLGEAHARRWGPNPAFLVKLLNSRDRLLVQVHPDKERARRHFGSEFGKTEAWYVIEAEEGALVHAGFKPGITRELLREAILEGDSDRILGLLHAFEAGPGELLSIPAGLPHALGSGSLVLEIQEPTDITLRAERRRPSGELLPEDFLHAGKGMEVLLDCFDLEGLDRAEARARIFLEPRAGRSGAGWSETALLPPSPGACFSMRALELEPGASYRSGEGGYALALVLSGRGSVEGGGRRLALGRGSELCLPHGLREYSYRAEGGLRLVECRPPAATDGGAAS